MATSRMSSFLRQLTRGMAAQTLADHADRDLVQRLLNKPDEAAFEALVRRHGPMVYRVCWRILQQAEDVEDAFQATFLLLARKLTTVKKRDSLASWLHGVAHRVSLDAKKHAAKRRRHERQAPVSSSDPPDDLTWKELRTVLDAELASLPEKFRLPLILCYLEGQSQEEAARQLSWSKRTLMRRLEEARSALGRRLTRKGFAWSAALSGVLLSDCVAPAALSSRFIGSTVEAAASALVGRAAPGIVSANVTALTEGVVKTMSVSKMKFVVPGVLLVGALVSGARVLFVAHRAKEPFPLDGTSGLAQAAEADEPKEPAFLVSAREVATMPAKTRTKFMALQQGGKALLTITAAGEVVSWNLQTQKASAPRQLPGKNVLGLSADGTVAVIADGKIIRDVDPATHQVKSSRREGNPRLLRVADTATGRVLATVETAGPPPGTAERVAARKPHPDVKYPPGTFNPNGTFKFNPDDWIPVNAALAPDNRTLAAESGSYLEVWSLRDDQAKRIANIEQPFDRPDAPMITFAFSADAKRVAIGGYDGLVIWDLTARKRMLFLPLKLEQDNTYSSIAQLEDVAFTPDGRTVIAAGSRHYSWGDVLRQQRKTARTCWLRAWNTANGVEKWTREYAACKEDVGKENHRPRFETAAISGNGAVLAAGSVDGRVKLIAPRTGQELGTVRVAGLGDWYKAYLSTDARTLILKGGRVVRVELTKGRALIGNEAEPADGWVPPWKPIDPNAQPAAAEKPSPAAKEYHALLKEHKEYFDRVEKEAAKLKSDEAMRQFMEKYRLQPQVFARRFLDLAQKYPETPEAVDALWFAFTMMSNGPEAEQAVAALAGRYMKHEKTTKQFERVVTGPHPRAGRDLLRAFAQSGATEQVRAQASFKLAKSLAAVADLTERLRDDKSGVVSRQMERDHPLGDELVKSFLAENPDQLRAEAKKLFEEIAAKHGSVPHPYMRGTLGEAVEWELADLRNPTLAVGKTAPDIESKDVKGQAFKLSDYRGQVVLLTFSGNWCGPCRAMYPHERALVERLKGKRFVALSVNTDREKKTLEESIRKGEITWRCWWDGSGGEGPISKSWHIEGFPDIFVLDAKGVIRFRGLRGEALDQAIDSLLKEQEAPTTR